MSAYPFFDDAIDIHRTSSNFLLKVEACFPDGLLDPAVLTFNIHVSCSDSLCVGDIFSYFQITEFEPGAPGDGNNPPNPY